MQERLDDALAQIAALTAKVEQLQQLRQLEPQLAQLTLNVQNFKEQSGTRLQKLEEQSSTRFTKSRSTKSIASRVTKSRVTKITLLSNQLQQLSSELDENKQSARRGAELSVIVMLVISYSDLLSDVYVAISLPCWARSRRRSVW
jgi:hypothetical protein